MPSRPDARHDAAQLRDRVRLYLQVMLFIDVCAYGAEAIGPVTISDLDVPVFSRSLTLLRWTMTALVATGWAIVEFRRPSEKPVVVLETAITLALVVAYAQVGIANRTGALPWFGSVFALFGVLLLLVVRASLVPSPVSRTLSIGVVSTACVFWMAREPLRSLEPVVLGGLVFLSGAFVVVIGVTSHVIYGLRAEVRDAKRLGQYTLEAKLGQGGMGEVYRARHSRLRRSTAIKLLPVSRTSAGAVARFESEVQLTATLTHPNTIRIFDYGRTDDGVFYYAMEYLEGATLDQVVAVDGPQPVARVLYILEQAAGALEEAHTTGLIHRDIKPANIMLTRQGLDPDAVKVLDFGLVRRLDGADSGVTRDGTLVGTPLYMAPEVIVGADSAVAASDLYALGAVGYFLATGSHVFGGATLIETCAHHLHSQPESLAARRGSPVAEDFEALILQCLAKKPDDRPADAGAFIARLRQCRDHGAWTNENAKAWWQRCAAALKDAAARAHVPVGARSLSIATPRTVRTELDFEA